MKSWWKLTNWHDLFSIAGPGDMWDRRYLISRLCCVLTEILFPGALEFERYAIHAWSVIISTHNWKFALQNKAPRSTAVAFCNNWYVATTFYIWHSHFIIIDSLFRENMLIIGHFITLLFKCCFYCTINFRLIIFHFSYFCILLFCFKSSNQWRYKLTLSMAIFNLQQHHTLLMLISAWWDYW